MKRFTFSRYINLMPLVIILCIVAPFPDIGGFKAFQINHNLMRYMFWSTLFITVSGMAIKGVRISILLIACAQIVMAASYAIYALIFVC